MNDELKTSEEWNEIHKRFIMDPDGWDRSNWQYSWYEEKITELEFKKRLARSTIRH